MALIGGNLETERVSILDRNTELLFINLCFAQECPVL